MKKILGRFGFLFASLALMTAEYSANFCYFVFHQPKIPDSVMKLKK
ncbi:MAG: cyclic lactone autoinducer peptide [Oscillospiraceae bacterium]|nr:cyclic lactone autoinducer peptide [Oscillospiraceae bacterium]